MMRMVPVERKIAFARHAALEAAVEINAELCARPGSKIILFETAADGQVKLTSAKGREPSGGVWERGQCTYSKQASSTLNSRASLRSILKVPSPDDGIHRKPAKRFRREDRKKLRWKDCSEWTVVSSKLHEYHGSSDSDLWWTPQDLKRRKESELRLVRGIDGDVSDQRAHVLAIQYLRYCYRTYKAMVSECVEIEGSDVKTSPWARLDFQRHFFRHSEILSGGIQNGFRGMENGGYSNRRSFVRDFIKIILEAQKSVSETELARLAERKSRADLYWAQFMAQADKEHEQTHSQGRT